MLLDAQKMFTGNATSPKRQEEAKRKKKEAQEQAKWPTIFFF
jgi:hypothetical protein